MTSTARDIRQQPFYWIDRHFLPTHGGQIGPYAIAVYNALVFRSDRAGRAFPGVSDLMDLTGIKSRHTVRRAINTLVKAGLVRVNQRFDGVKYDSNEYYVLPMDGAPDAPGVGQEMPQGRALDAPPSAPDAPGVGQEMPQGRAGDAQYLQSLNNNHLNNNHLITISNNSSMALPAAAASILSDFSLDPQKLDGQAENLAAWLVYAMTQPGLRNPVGYAMTRIRHGEVASDVFQEIVNIDLDWEHLPGDAHQERVYRTAPGVVGLQLYEELEPVSDDAIKILDELWEAQR